MLRMSDTSCPKVASEEGAARIGEFEDTFNKALSKAAESAERGAADQQRDYYIDALRWPEKAIWNLAKQEAVSALCLPRKLNFEVTTRCILKCDFCVLHSGALSKRRRTPFMDYSSFRRIFFHMEPFLTHIEFTGGEPLLNDDLFKMIDLCNLHFVKTTIATNAQILTDRRIENMLDAPPSVLLVAFEGGDKTGYEAHRQGGKFNKLSANLHRLVESRRSRGQFYPHIRLQTVVSRKTAEHLEGFWKYARDLGADSACIKPLFIWPDGPIEYRKLMIKEYLIPGHPLSYYNINQAGELEETGEAGFCPNTGTAHIGTGGEVVPCWYNLLSSPCMGNTIEKHFFDIWFSESYLDFRRRMAAHTAYRHKCRFCIGIYRQELFQVRYFQDHALGIKQ